MRKTTIVGLALLLSGCTATAPDTSGSGQKVDRPVTVQALGDLATFDACDLVTAADLSEFGVPSEVPASRLDSCAYQLGGGKVEFGDLLMFSEAEFARFKPTEMPGKATAGLYRSESTECGVYLRLDSGETFQVLASDREAPCDVANATARAIAARIAKGDPVARAAQPARSLREIDACSVLTADVLAAVPGQGGTPTLSPGGHMCTVSVELAVLFRSGELAPSPQVKADKVVIDGTEWIVTDDIKDFWGCSATTGYTRLTPASSDTWELVEVVVSLPDREQSCAAAKAVAGLVWAKLPRA
ncbi:DUF3558 family protein [Actinokineospora sp. HUAS TT18]|uniref:DUF3558 family protein n=1 Tax=Actinokineospora sp. HUAS TT18 TaxID=3447451 RepID=UPI003F521422